MKDNEHLPWEETSESSAIIQQDSEQENVACRGDLQSPASPSRKQARDMAFKLVYQFTVKGDVSDVTPIEEDSKTVQNAFCQTLYGAVVDNLSAIDDRIKSLIKDFDFERLFKIDLAILRLGVGELLFIKGDKTPSAVVIGAMVDLAKKYSTEKSMAFINGVLAGVSV